jgi:hypothetical protein
MATVILPLALRYLGRLEKFRFRHALLIGFSIMFVIALSFGIWVGDDGITYHYLGDGEFGTEIQLRSPSPDYSRCAVKGLMSVD